MIKGIARQMQLLQSLQDFLALMLHHSQEILKRLPGRMLLRCQLGKSLSMTFDILAQGWGYCRSSCETESVSRGIRRETRDLHKATFLHDPDINIFLLQVLITTLDDAKCKEVGKVFQ